VDGHIALDLTRLFARSMHTDFRRTLFNGWATSSSTIDSYWYSDTIWSAKVTLRSVEATFMVLE
jgi:hypothetical protein